MSASKGYQRERDEFLRIVQDEGMSYDVAVKLMRYSQTLHRLAEAQCNGDWPYNGDRDRPSRSCGCGLRQEHAQTEACKQRSGQERWDGHYTTCPKCEASGVSKSIMRVSSEMRVKRGDERGERYNSRNTKFECAVKVCPDCRTVELVKAALPEGFTAVISGDPRGCVFKVKVPSGRTNDWGKEGICVPVRER
jgi:hypothetical protein